MRKRGLTTLIMLIALSALFASGGCTGERPTPAPSSLAPTATGMPSEKQPSADLPASNPGIALTPNHGRSGTVVGVEGSGFPAGSIVQVRLSGINSQATLEAYTSVQANESGIVTATFTMPAFWPSGDPIVQPQIVVLASTPDFVHKASTVFSYDSDFALETPLPQGRGPVQVAQAFVSAWINGNANEVLSYLEGEYRSTVTTGGVQAGIAHLMGVQNTPAAATFQTLRYAGTTSVVRATLELQQGTSQADITLKAGDNGWQITSINPAR